MTSSNSAAKTGIVPGGRIVVAHTSQSTVDKIWAAFAGTAHELTGPLHTGRELAQHMESTEFDLVISGTELNDGNGLDVLVEVGKVKSVPAVIITHEDSLHLVDKALSDHVWAYLIEPIAEQEILPTTYLVMKRFEQFEELQTEAETLRIALDDRKIVERAKGILMATLSLSEDEAHRTIQRQAKDQRMKLVQAAQRILNQHEKPISE